MKRKRTLILLVALLLSIYMPSHAYASSFSVKFKESAINGLASRIGSISDSGHHTVSISYPCFVCTDTFLGICYWGYWTTCSSTIYSASWRWTIFNVTFDINPSGITYTGQLRATYGFLSYTTNVSGTADVSVYGNNIQLQLSRIRIPIGFDVPGIGHVTITNIDRSLPYNATLTLGGIGLRTNPPGGSRTYWGRFSNIARQYLSNEILVSGDVIFW
jgi:hypothetical protein